MSEAEFRGTRLSELPIESVDWLHRAEHIRTRRQRLGDSEFDVEPEWATEAATDEARLVSSGSGVESIEVIGLSPSAPPRKIGDVGRVLKVWLVPKDARLNGEWWGASACDANTQDRTDYWEVDDDD